MTQSEIILGFYVEVAEYCIPITGHTYASIKTKALESQKKTTYLERRDTTQVCKPCTTQLSTNRVQNVRHGSYKVQFQAQRSIQ
jgi:hypothetical protein